MTSDEIFTFGAVCGAVLMWLAIRVHQWAATLDEPEVDDDRW